MDRKTELDLIDELLALKSAKTAFLDEDVRHNPMDHYTSPVRFEHERERIFRTLPVAAAHSSEISGPGDFVRRDIAGSPAIITRDKNGQPHALFNVCRHRGARLVEDEKGCKHRFTCPYHAWTYANSGELLAAPHFAQGFPGLDKSDIGLARLPCAERFGFVWISPRQDAGLDLDFLLDGLGPDLEALKLDDMVIAAQETNVRQANWKILIEGGIEAYHFRVAHRHTIGPHFEDNLSSYRSFGPHLRSVLPRTSMSKLSETNREDWCLRDHANILYTLFPSSQLLVMQDHIVWIKTEPVSADATRVTLATLAPRAQADETAHWHRNHVITSTTLAEDFVIGEGIQAGAPSGANRHVLFGRFEGALGTFNRTVEGYLDP